MITLYGAGAYLLPDGQLIPESDKEQLEGALGGSIPSKESARKNTMAYGILEAHNTSGDMESLRIKFDAMASHDITYVGIVQTARASGLTQFPLPYVLTNCHNSLCAVGGTINEDDHVFGLSAAQKYGGIYVPAHQAVIHQYMREMMSRTGSMILGSDSHTRYGALGTMAVGEGGPELVKQLLGKTYDIQRPEVVAIYLTGAPVPGVGPQDVALAIIGATFQNGYVKNKIMEFTGPGIKGLSADYRIGIDVMTTETTCLSSIWSTDDEIKGYYAIHGRLEDYKELAPSGVAYYDGAVTVDLSAIRPMIAMPFHPSNVYTIEELLANLDDILHKVEQEGQAQIEGGKATFTLRDKVRNGGLYVDQAVIAGCSGGTFENICDAADILQGCSLGVEAFALSVYPSSQPVFLELVQNGAIARLMTAGASIRSAFCGPCFGAGDVPANGGLSIRHTTRNFPSREGSKPSAGQIASVALMDARSIAATSLKGGRLTPATDLDVDYTKPNYKFDPAVYENRCYNGYGKPQPGNELKFGPNIADWPAMEPLAENLMLRVACLITDPVTTTDELIPSGETSSYRSNPLRLAEFTLSRKDPDYVGRAKAVQRLQEARLAGSDPASLDPALAAAAAAVGDVNWADTGIGSVVYARKPGDGSAREQAASCQKVLGTFANLAAEYATKRYRSNLINWGMLPFLLEDAPGFEVGDYIYIPGIRRAVENKAESIPAYAITGDSKKEISLSLGGLTDDEREIILSGCLINFYRDAL